MALQESAAEWMKRVRSEAHEAARQQALSEALRVSLRARFGHVDEALEHVMEALVRLPLDEAMTTALNLSREELLRRFGPRQ